MEVAEAVISHLGLIECFEYVGAHMRWEIDKIQADHIESKSESLSLISSSARAPYPADNN